MSSNPKNRRVPAHAPKADGDRAEFALRRLKDAMSEVKRLDCVLLGQESYIGRCMTGINDDAAVMAHARDMEEALDRLWKSMSEAYVTIKKRTDWETSNRYSREGALTVYPGEKWPYSLTEACPLCGSLLMHGPRPSDWRCSYCDKPISHPVPAPPNHP